MAHIDRMDSEQLDVIEAEVLRQRTSMTQRKSSANTRAAVLIGVSGALGGTALVTASGNILISSISLAFYLLAAVLGLVSLRSTRGQEVSITRLIKNYADYSVLSLRRAGLLSNLDSHADDVKALLTVHKLLTGGFTALVLAWVCSGVGTVYGLAHPSDSPTTIEIEGDVNVRLK